jgi:precorrin-3B C17-methyltransferase
LFVVGIGPGNPLDRTKRAELAIKESSIIVGYTPYIESIKDLTSEKTLVSSGMRAEIERCTIAVENAMSGKTVSLISSGDPGVYGMAGLAIEIASKRNSQIQITIIPGVTAATAAAAALGAPLMTDFAVISLSDLLVPWEQIEKRLLALAQSGMTTVLYNPKSISRTEPFSKMISIFSKFRLKTTPVGIVTSASNEDQQIVMTTLSELANADVGMKSVLIICNEFTSKVSSFLIAQRGYKVE